MTDAPTPTPIALHRALEAVWRTPPGWGRLSAVNHTVVGRRFILTALVFFAIGGLLAMLLRVQLARPGSDFLTPEAYNQIFTMHGTVMMFLFAIPLIEGLALYLLPKLLGARDLAFPRLSSFGYWCYLFGGAMLVLSLVLGLAPRDGWFMYTPLSSSTYSPGINADFWLIGITFVEVSAIAAAVEIVVTVLKVRAPGMALHKMPLMAWYLLVTAMMMAVGFPPLILGSVLLEVERAFDWPFFDPVRGGDPLLWQHLFWLFGHPEVYIIFLPAAGAISTIIPVFARRPIVGYLWIVCAIIALAFLSFGLWVHHMFTVGIPHLALAFFSAASTLVAVPTAVQIFSWTATLVKGRPELSLPMLYILGFFFVFITGGLTGVMVAIVPFDWQVHDTHFIVAHLHYVLVGGFVFPMIGATYYWLPHLIGRRPVYDFGKVAFWLIFIGFNLSFLIMHLTGLLGMPRRVFTYAAGLGWDLPNLISSFGAFVMTFGFALLVVDIVLQTRFGQRFRRNPWGAGTLDWAMPTPPTNYGFGSLPHVGDRDPLHADPALPAELAGGRGYLGRVREGRMETLGVDMVTGRASEIVILPNSSFLPLWTALATGGFFVSILLKLYWLAPVAMALVAACGWRWLWSCGRRADPPPEDAGRGLTLPLHATMPGSPAWWGLVFFLLADGAFFAALVFGYLFLFVVTPGWPPPELLAPDPLGAALAVAGLVAAPLAARAAKAANADGRETARERWLLAALAASLVAMAGLLLTLVLAAPSPTVHAYGAATAALGWYVAGHLGLGAFACAYALARCRAGYVSPLRAIDMRGAALWQLYTGATGLVAVAMIHLLPAAL